MYILRAIFILLVVPVSLKAQSTAFFKVYSSGSFDIGEGVCQLADSSYIITGSTGGLSTTSPQAFVSKLDKEGNPIWTQAIGSSEAETGRRVFYLNDTIYVLGRTNSFGNSYDYYLFSLDTLGNVITDKAIGSSDFDWLQDAVFLPKDSSFVLYGYRQESQGFNKYRQLTKITMSGTVLWQKEELVHFDTRFKNMHLINDSVFGFVGSEYNTSKSRFDGLFKAYDYQGVLVDSIRFNNTPSRNFCFNDFAISSANRLKIVGEMYYSNQAGDFSDMRMWTYRLGVDTLIWGGTNNGIGDNYKTSYTYLIQKRFAPKEYFFIESASVSNFPTYSDGLLDESISAIFYDNEAYFLNGVTNVSASGNDVSNQAISTLDGGMVVVGYNEYFGNDAQNATLLKIGPNSEAVVSNAVPVEEQLVLETKSIAANLSFEVYPNPTNGVLSVNVLDFTRAEIISVSGEVLMQATSNVIDVSDLTSGIYLLRVQAGNSFGFKRFVKY